MAPKDLTAKINDHISHEIDAVMDFRQALSELLRLKDEYEDNGYFAIITQDHIVGDNVHMTPELIANVYSSVSAINAFMEANFHDDILAQAAR